MRRLAIVMAIIAALLAVDARAAETPAPKPESEVRQSPSSRRRADGTRGARRGAAAL